MTSYDSLIGLEKRVFVFWFPVFDWFSQVPWTWALLGKKNGKESLARVDRQSVVI